MIDSADDPCDSIDVENLGGWIKNDGSGSGEKNPRKRLERDYRDRYTNSWTRFEHG